MREQAGGSAQDAVEVRDFDVSRNPGLQTLKQAQKWPGSSEHGYVSWDRRGALGGIRRQKEGEECADALVSSAVSPFLSQGHPPGSAGHGVCPSGLCMC